MSIYLDTSVIAALFIERDNFADRARAIVFDDDQVLVVSAFAGVEFASVVARLMRTNQIIESAAREVFETFDLWRSQLTDSEEITPVDLRTALSIVRRLDLIIRAPDAINLAIALRIGATLATFDRRMAQNARVLGIAVAPI